MVSMNIRIIGFSLSIDNFDLFKNTKKNSSRCYDESKSYFCKNYFQIWKHKSYLLHHLSHN